MRKITVRKRFTSQHVEVELVSESPEVVVIRVDGEDLPLRHAGAGWFTGGGLYRPGYVYQQG